MNLKIKKLREIAKWYTDKHVYHEGSRLELHSSEIAFRVNERTSVSFSCYNYNDTSYNVCVIDNETDIHVSIDFYKDGDFYLWVHYWKTRSGNFFRKEKRVITKSLSFYSGRPYDDEEFQPAITDEHEWIKFMLERMTTFL